MKLLKKEQHELHENAKVSYICYEKFENKYLKYKKYYKERETILTKQEIEKHCAQHIEFKCSVPKKIYLVFYNGSNYYFCLSSVKYQQKRLIKNLIVLEKTLKNIQFLQFQYKKKLSRINKNEKEVIKNISYTLQFTDSARFMASS